MMNLLIGWRKQMMMYIKLRNMPLKIKPINIYCVTLQIYTYKSSAKIPAKLFYSHYSPSLKIKRSSA
jgi:hypothetical protein